MITETHRHGEWPSPIQGADVARMRVGLSFPVISGTRVWWQETRPSEGGRLAVVCQGPDGVRHDVLPLSWNARTRVHEYGGRSYLPLPDGFLFANFTDQRLYRSWGAWGDGSLPRGSGGMSPPGMKSRGGLGGTVPPRQYSR